MALGKKTGGGSRKGTPNKRTAERAAAIEAEGITPLQFMLNAMRDEDKDFATRLDAAFKAAPYVHPKLSSTEAKVEADVSVDITSIRLVGPDG